MPVIGSAELAPIRRLIEIAGSDTGQSRRVANFLLAWWNAGDCGGFDLTDLWMVNKKIADDMLATAAFVATHREYPNSYGLKGNFETLVALWRPQLLQKTTCQAPPSLQDIRNETASLFSSRWLSPCAIKSSWRQPPTPIRPDSYPPPRRCRAACLPAKLTRIRCWLPLAEAQDAVARLEATAATASSAVVEGLRARVAYREAAGWLAHAHTWIHPRDLALRDAGLTGSYTAAALAGRLDAELPTMTAAGQQARRRAIRRRGRQRAPPGPALAPARRAPHLAAGRRRPRPCGKPSAPWAGR